MPEIAYVNGRFTPLAEAVISVEDRGFQFGDGVYEVIRTYRGRPFHLDAHLARLERSLGAVGLAMPVSLPEWRRLIDEGLARSGFAESKIYVQITRGVAPRDHVFPAQTRPTVVMTIRELHALDPALVRSGVTVITVEDLRWGRCDIKSVNLLANVLARQRAKEAGVFEALFVRGAHVTEGSASNVMMIRQGELHTPPEGPAILSGVTRSLVLALAGEEGLKVHERLMTVEELVQADEVLLCGTTIEILPVVAVDGRLIGAGRPGPVTGRLAAQFRAMTDQ